MIFVYSELFCAAPKGARLFLITVCASPSTQSILPVLQRGEQTWLPDSLQRSPDLCSEPSLTCLGPLQSLLHSSTTSVSSVHCLLTCLSPLLLRAPGRQGLCPCYRCIPRTWHPFQKSRRYRSPCSAARKTGEVVLHAHSNTAQKGGRAGFMHHCPWLPCDLKQVTRPLSTSVSLFVKSK